MVWILPTFSRPAQCQEILHRISQSGCTTPGIVFVNGSEYATAYRELVLPENWKMEWSPENIGALAALNMVFEMYPNEPWYGFWGDDEHLMPDNPRDWDLRMIAAAGDWNLARVMKRRPKFVSLS